MAEFISNSKCLARIFRSLCERFDFFEWCIAWAGDIKTMPISLLDNHIDKISHIVVGLHFYQTSPSFIENYIDHEGVKFIKQTDGTFHPKVYLFHDRTGEEWAAIIGSSNFTNHGFNKNIEANVLLTSENSNKKIFKEILSFVHRQWDSASSFSKIELENYRQCYLKQRSMTHSLSKVVRNSGNEILETRVFDLKTWEEYASEVMNNEDYAARVRLLEKARELFKRPFYCLSPQDRIRLAGCPKKEENELSNDEETCIDWNFFGKTLRYKIFRDNVEGENAHLGIAIDSISLNGKITKEDYEKYIKEFKMAFPDAVNPIACATRLLAIKRPDVFICVDSKNRESLSKQYGFPQSRLTIDNYWDLLIKRIQESAWFSEAPETEELSKYKVAMLDSLHYKK